MNNEAYKEIIKNPAFSISDTKEITLFSISSLFPDLEIQEIEQCLESMVKSGMLDKYKELSSGDRAYKKTELLYREREVFLKRLGLRHPSLISQRNFSLEHLILALITATHISNKRLSGMVFGERTCKSAKELAIYLSDYSEQEILSCCDEMIEKNYLSIVERQVGSLKITCFDLSSLGIRAYKRETQLALSLNNDSSILDYFSNRHSSSSKNYFISGGREIEKVIVERRFDNFEDLGSGAYATVYKADDLKLNRKVAIKFLTYGIYTEQLITQARLLAQVNHENIVTIHDVTEIENEKGEMSQGIVMELLDGQDLDTFLSTHHFVNPEREIYNIILQILNGISHLHENNIFHGDLHGGNILILNNSKVKIIDMHPESISQYLHSTMSLESKKKRDCLLLKPLIFEIIEKSDFDNVSLYDFQKKLKNKYTIDEIYKEFTLFFPRE